MDETQYLAIWRDDNTCCSVQHGVHTGTVVRVGSPEASQAQGDEPQGQQDGPKGTCKLEQGQ